MALFELVLIPNSKFKSEVKLLRSFATCIFWLFLNIFENCCNKSMWLPGSHFNWNSEFDAKNNDILNRNPEIVHVLKSLERFRSDRPLHSKGEFCCFFLCVFFLLFLRTNCDRTTRPTGSNRISPVPTAAKMRWLTWRLQQHVLPYWRSWVVVGVPLLLLPLPISGHQVVSGLNWNILFRSVPDPEPERGHLGTIRWERFLTTSQAWLEWFRIPNKIATIIRRSRSTWTHFSVYVFFNPIHRLYLVSIYTYSTVLREAAVVFFQYLLRICDLDSGEVIDPFILSAGIWIVGHCR